MTEPYNNFFRQTKKNKFVPLKKKNENLKNIKKTRKIYIKQTFKQNKKKHFKNFNLNSEF